jgi:AmmeMemoRadiSam system protein B
MGRKRASFRGTWYPDSKDECESHIKDYLKDNNGIFKGDFQGCIVPHAGWYFSGSIACRTIASLALSDHDRTLDCVIVFGLHMGKNDSPFLFESGSWETPFGDIDIHESLGSKIVEQAEIKGVKLTKKSYKSFPKENTIELQLPFIKYFFQNIPIVPIGVPPSQDAIKTAQAVFNAVKDTGLNISVIGSTDLTHYGQSFGFTPAGQGEKSYEWVKNENDASAVKALVSMDAGQIISNGNTKHNMCCAGAAAATATICKQLGSTKGIRIEYASSYSRSPGESFVGYTGIIYHA